MFLGSVRRLHRVRGHVWDEVSILALLAKTTDSF